MKVQIARNSPQSILIGASWSYHRTWGKRRTHVYIGRHVLTITTAGGTP